MATVTSKDLTVVLQLLTVRFIFLPGNVTNMAITEEKWPLFLGERLDLPATAITEAVIEEHLRPRGVPETILVPLQEQFQTCNVARYAPVKSSEELAAIIPRFEAVLRQVQGVKL